MKLGRKIDLANIFGKLLPTRRAAVCWIKSKFTLLALPLVFWGVSLHIEKIVEEHGIFDGLIPGLYRFLDNWRFAQPTPQPILLVDLSDWISTNGIVAHSSIPYLQIRRSLPFTNRRALGDLVERLVHIEPKPSAIGIDIDFSLPSQEELRQLPPTFISEHYEFIDRCLRLQGEKTNPPIFLGVARSVGGKPETLLANPDWTCLAASIYRRVGDNIYMPSELAWETDNGMYNLPSLAKAMTDSVPGQSFSKPVWNWAVQQYECFPKGTNAAITQFYMDYRDLPMMTNGSCIKASTLLETNELAQKCLISKQSQMILIGNVGRGEQADMAKVPTLDEPVSGILLQACALSTLLKHPLYKLKGWADVLISAIVFLLLLFVEEWLRRRAIYKFTRGISFYCLLLVDHLPSPFHKKALMKVVISTISRSRERLLTFCMLVLELVLIATISWLFLNYAQILPLGLLANIAVVVAGYLVTNIFVLDDKSRSLKTHQFS